ncbi:4Fe-4S dicluster domain-containing protein [Adlercreutzia sp. R25]|uniref:4Fe-4S dicluster domain-containing protein n=1 Tax=Adlercreutzia shanghongiae TaxID=3111773 RepID=UPI002DBBA02A|nr:4Fe-4S dicluster domain-containing protein [Adlercreutzia sp. R25]MEC4273685.1 4Fe-4S dicluster domain-containing protein [Adlercreutzia sp. R25]
MHCESPSCATVCPAAAISKGPGGIVTVDETRCIGCKYCYEACPFEAPRYDEVSMYKCDCCRSAGVQVGDTPYCVRACKTQALRYGQLNDLLELSERVQRIEGPTKPSAALV